VCRECGVAVCERCALEQLTERPLALLQQASDVQRRLDGRPLRPWGRTPSELAALNGDATRSGASKGAAR
jgi:hypothetical protein